MPRIIFLALSLTATLALPLRAEDNDDDDDPAKESIEFPSPDGQFAFRRAKDKTDPTINTFDLINARSGAVLLRVAESEPDPGPSNRFHMQVLWRRDSAAFALTAMFMKRGSVVEVYLRNGTDFRKVELPELVAEITAKAKGGKEYSKTYEENSQTAKRWEKDGSLTLEIETMMAGNDGSISAVRTASLGFDKTAKARLLKSSIKFKKE